MAGNLTAMIASIFSGSAVTPDPYFKNTTLLLPGNGTNGATNNTFLDASTNNFTITRNGNTTQGTFSPFSQTGWGNLFGSGNYLNTASNAAFGMGTGDFTVEAWIFATSSLTGYQAIFADGFVTNSVFFGNTAGGFGLRAGNASDILVTTAPSINQWVHVAVTRSSSTVRLFYNGTQQTTIANSTNFVTQSAYVGNDGGGSAFPGYISNLRVVKGQALYTGNFTPATSALNVSTVGSTGAGVPTQTITGTVSLLTCQSNRFIDNGNGNSGVGFTFTRTGSPSVQAFSPFNPTASWSAATNGGSGYFDGNADYLNVSSSLFNPAGAFTIELWFYATDNTTTYQGLVSTWPDGASPAQGIQIWKASSTGQISIGNASTGGTTIASFTWATYLNQWNHLALVRDSSNSCAVFLNGNRLAAPVTKSGSPGQTSLTIGRAFPNNANYYFTGYMSNVRFVSGSNEYDPASSTITVPTAPLTAVANTSLLLNFTNAGIYDATSKNDLETVSGAQISTAISAKWGSGSIYLSGDGHYLTSRGSPVFSLNGDFTMEAWVYPIDAGRSADAQKYGTILSCGFPGTSNPEFSWFIRIVGGVITEYFINLNSTTVLQVTGLSVSLNAWHYFAVTRSGTSTGNVKLYIDGTLVGTSSSASTQNPTFTSSQNLLVGRNASSTAYQNWLSGYFQDVRVTPGYVRTVTTTPTAAFPTL